MIQITAIKQYHFLSIGRGVKAWKTQWLFQYSYQEIKVQRAYKSCQSHSVNERARFCAIFFTKTKLCLQHCDPVRREFCLWPSSFPWNAGFADRWKGMLSQSPLCLSLSFVQTMCTVGKRRLAVELTTCSGDQTCYP